MFTLPRVGDSRDEVAGGASGHDVVPWTLSHPDVGGREGGEGSGRRETSAQEAQDQVPDFPF